MTSTSGAVVAAHEACTEPGAVPDEGASSEREVKTPQKKASQERFASQADPCQKVLIYGLGYPGSGKSTGFASAGEDMDCRIQDKPFPVVVFENGMCLFGKQEGINPGTDTLTFNVKTKVLDWMRTKAPGLILAEGARLANKAFFEACKDLGYEVHIVLIDVPKETAKQRFIERGSKWDDKKQTWFKGVCTLVDNLKPLATKTIDGSQDAECVRDELKDFFRTQLARVQNVWGSWKDEAEKLPTLDEHMKKLEEEMQLKNEKGPRVAGARFVFDEERQVVKFEVHRQDHDIEAKAEDEGEGENDKEEKDEDDEPMQAAKEVVHFEVSVTETCGSQKLALRVAFLCRAKLLNGATKAAAEAYRENLCKMIPRGPDVDEASEAWAKIRTNVNHSCPNVQFCFIRELGEKKERIPFMTTVNAAGGNILEAERIARLCYAKFASGSTKEDVLAYRGELYKDVSPTTPAVSKRTKQSFLTKVRAKAKSAAGPQQTKLVFKKPPEKEGDSAKRPKRKRSHRAHTENDLETPAKASRAKKAKQKEAILNKEAADQAPAATTPSPVVTALDIEKLTVKLEAPSHWPPGVVVDTRRRIHWLPEEWGQGFKATVSGKALMCFISPGGKAYYHKSEIESACFNDEPMKTLNLKTNGRGDPEYKFDLQTFFGGGPRPRP